MLMSILRSKQGLDFMELITYIISVLLIVFLVNPLHECAHGLAAYKLGDRTAKNQGRLTLNPLAHVDYVGSLMILILGFGWAKPVPVSARNFKNPKRDMALTALAGPVANLLAAIVCGLLYNGTVTIMIKACGAKMAGSALLIPNNLAFMKYVLLLFSFLMIINIALAVFNLIPIPPLDGSKILMAFLPDKTVYKMYQYQTYFTIALFVLIMMSDVIDILSPVRMLFYNGISWLTALPFSWAW